MSQAVEFDLDAGRLILADSHWRVLSRGHTGDDDDEARVALEQRGAIVDGEVHPSLSALAQAWSAPSLELKVTVGDEAVHERWEVKASTEGFVASLTDAVSPKDYQASIDSADLPRFLAHLVGLRPSPAGVADVEIESDEPMILESLKACQVPSDWHDKLHGSARRLMLLEVNDDAAVVVVNFAEIGWFLALGGADHWNGRCVTSTEIWVAFAGFASQPVDF